ncbi:MAG: glycosyltransferase [Bryobacteraceae bacterium]
MIFCLTVSAIIPTYNSAHFLPEAIDSVLAQTFPPDEIIVVDDGSTDDTEAAIKPFLRHIRFLKQRNRGPAAARNFGIRQARGHWIAMLDADDRWLPSKTARQAKALAGSPDSILVYSGLVLVHPDGNAVHKPAAPLHSVWPALRCRNVITSPSAVMIHRETAIGAGLFDEDHRIIGSEDWDLWIRLWQHSGGRYCCEPEPLTQYRLHEDNLSHRASLMLEGGVTLLDRSLLNGLHGVERELWRRRILSSLYWQASVNARKEGRAKERSYLVHSLATWPSLFSERTRWKALINNLCGRGPWRTPSASTPPPGPYLQARHSFTPLTRSSPAVSPTPEAESTPPP